MQNSFEAPQLWMRTAAMGLLEDEIADNLDKYRSGTFSIPPSDTSEMAVVKAVRPDLASDMKATTKSEAEDAILLYEALPGLTQQMAAEKRLWVYLGHTVLLDFIRRRFPIPDDDQKAVSHIKRRWFMGNTPMRDALYSLWFSVSLTIDESNPDDKYHLTRILLSNYSLRTTWLTVILRIPHVLRGILIFFAKHKHELHGAELSLRYLSSYFNRLGAGSLLTILAVDEVVELCEGQLDTLKSIRNRENLYEAYRNLGGSPEEVSDEDNQDEEISNGNETDR